MRVWICLVYKISRVIVARDILSSLFSSSWQNKYSNLKTICHINQNVSCELNSLRTYYFQNIPYLFLQFFAYLFFFMLHDSGYTSVGDSETIVSPSYIKQTVQRNVIWLILEKLIFNCIMYLMVCKLGSILNS